ncbi:uncharacterized protein BJX67DRAFT_233404 [Aspergillus lucknowensis]|uniref:Uncharacterized protein n=1 Tax=Aspergillus lucknowensis TaxID=176173 RepID=A0ABR4LKJ6_9EURO
MESAGRMPSVARGTAGVVSRMPEHPLAPKGRIVPPLEWVMWSRHGCLLQEVSEGHSQTEARRVSASCWTFVQRSDMIFNLVCKQRLASRRELDRDQKKKKNNKLREFAAGDFRNCRLELENAQKASWERTPTWECFLSNRGARPRGRSLTLYLTGIEWACEAQGQGLTQHHFFGDACCQLPSWEVEGRCKCGLQQTPSFRFSESRKSPLRSPCLANPSSLRRRVRDSVQTAMEPPRKGWEAGHRQRV